MSKKLARGDGRWDEWDGWDEWDRWGPTNMGPIGPIRPIRPDLLHFVPVKHGHALTAIRKMNAKPLQ